MTVLNISPPVTTFFVCSYGLLLLLGSLYYEQYGPRSCCSLRELTVLTLSPLVTTFVVCSSSLLLLLGNLSTNNMDPDHTAPLGSSLIRVHIVCFHEKI